MLKILFTTIVTQTNQVQKPSFFKILIKMNAMRGEYL